MRRTALLAVALALGACARVHHTAAPEPKRPEAPDEGKEKGVPPRGEVPRVPASPEALLAPGAVGDIQGALAGRGLLGAHREGELDPPTSAALRRFQESERLAATGFPDRETLTRLGLDPDALYGRPGDAPAAKP